MHILVAHRPAPGPHITALCKLPSLFRMRVGTPSWRRACSRDNQRSLREPACEWCPPTLGPGEEVTQEPILLFLLACSTLPRSPDLQSPSLTLEGGLRWRETGFLILSHKDNPNTLPHTGPTLPQSFIPRILPEAANVEGHKPFTWEGGHCGHFLSLSRLQFLFWKREVLTASLLPLDSGWLVETPTLENALMLHTSPFYLDQFAGTNLLF